MSRETAQDRRTVLVQGISYDVQPDQFEEAFSEIGPLRKCFLLRDRGQERHKGSGFVQFALPEDAARAVKEYNGKVLLGRAVQVIPAQKRAPLAERKQKRKDSGEEMQQEAEHAPPQKRVKASGPPCMVDKQQGLRTVAVGCFPEASTKEVIKLANSIGEVEAVTQDISEAALEAAKLRQDGCKGSPILVTYKTVKAAVNAVSKLHKAILQTGKKKEPSAEVLWARQLKGEGALVKRWRLILRNLAFNASEKQIQDLLSPAGFVWEVTVPRKEDGTGRGFAFASFTSRSHAEKAIKLANGKKIKGRITAVDWAVSKADYDLGIQAPTAGVNGAQSVESDEAKAFREDKDVDEEEDVDPAAEKDMMRQLAGQFSDVGDEKPSKDDAAAAKKEKADRRSRADSAEKGPSSQGIANPVTPAPSPRPPGAGIGSTVFVRGLGSNISKQQLQARLESFGPVRACRLVMNPVTQQPKGTAFVEFASAATAQQAAAASSRGRSGEGPGVGVGGVTLDIDLAVTQDDARAMASKNASHAAAKDRRNLYLAKEGLIEEGSAIWQEMSRGDQEKRARANREKATKLRSPNFYVSTTRLNLRNLPYSMDEKALKTLLTAAVKERATKAVPQIKQIKVLRDPAKKDKEGNPQPKGIAFAEFSDHEHALCALRQLNNNPAPFGKDRRPIVEFAVENAQTVKMRESRLAKFKGEKPTAQSKTKSGRAARTAEEIPAAKGSEGNPTLKADKKKLAEPSGKSPAQATPSPLQTSQSGDSTPGKKQQKRKKPEGDLPGAQKRSAGLEQAAAVVKEAEPAPRRKRQQTSLRAAKDASKEGKNSKPEKTDRLDGLISKYRESLFGGKSGVQKSSQASSMKRWFE